MPSEVQYQFEDYSEERSSVRLSVVQLTAGNIAATEGQLTALETAMLGITLGELRQESVIWRRDEVSVAPVVSALAQREIKWLVRYHDTVTGKKYRAEIPTADLNGRLVANTDLADNNNAQVAAFITAFQAVVRDPDTGLNTVLIDSIQFVGRNT